MNVQAVILDIDGTLILSNEAHTQAWVEAFSENGYDVQAEAVRPLIGMGGDKIIPEVVPELNDKEGDGKKVSSKRKELMINHYAPNLSSANGSRELVQRMQSEGVKLIIATSATREELPLLLKAAQVEDLLNIDEAATRNDAEASKPSPDIIEAALKKLKIEPSQVVMLGDTPYDIEAAGKAGVGVIAVRCGGFSDEKLKDAIAIYNDPADLLAHYSTSPLSQT